jgi:hypothetical protein
MAPKWKHRRKPKVHWPDLRTPPDTWSRAEARGVAINPIVTGIGQHPRSISDEDWVLSCERDIQETGLDQFLTDLLHILRLTIPHCLGEPPAVGEYPRRMSEEDVPLPEFAYPSDGDEWNEKMIGNPVYAGIPPFPAIVDDKTWIAAGVKMVENVGLRRYLVDVLYELKQSVQAVAP